jgi:nitrate reductase delta subunit
MMTASKVPNASHSLRVLARLLSYPDAELRTDLCAMRDALHTEAALTAVRLAELDALMDALASRDSLDTEAAYVQLFDSGRATSLHLFEHVHGDSRDRGPAMIDLAQTYDKAGLHLAPGELPDYLPVVLEFVSTQPAREARAFMSEMAHIFNALFSALQHRQSAYASVLGALLELAGEQAQAVKLVPDEPLDDSWIEPAVFDGCSSKGQATPGRPQPINIVRKTSAARTASEHPRVPPSRLNESDVPVGGSAHHARGNQ